jgi:hypothetical protein
VSQLRDDREGFPSFGAMKESTPLLQAVTEITFGNTFIQSLITDFSTSEILDESSSSLFARVEQQPLTFSRLSSTHLQQLSSEPDPHKL